MNTKEIIRKWYKRLEVPARYDAEFEHALDTIAIREDTCIETYDLESADGAANFLAFLYMCEEAERRYQAKNIRDDIITETLKDIVSQADRYYSFGKTFYLGELGWLRHHVSADIFKLGRLQFAFGKAEYTSEKFGLKVGDPVMETHIDASGPLTPEVCDLSFRTADAFFREHYPEYVFKCYTCHSWILGSNVAKTAKEGSNLSEFRKRFDVIYEEPCDDILKYVFRWNTNRENFRKENAVSSFSQAVYRQAMKNETFYIGYGVIAHALTDG